jgi:hypothetical protein
LSLSATFVGADTTPVAPLYAFWNRFPLVAFLALPEQVSAVIDVLV